MMEVNAGRGFGWSLPLRGRAPDEIARELVGLRRQVEALAEAYFPAREGYEVEARAGERAAGSSGGFDDLRIAVRRGDFEAALEFVCVGPREQGAPAWVRLGGRSASRSLERARLRGLGVSDLLRWVMGGVGVAGFLAMSSLLLVIPPRFAVETLFVLGGLLMVVVAILTLVVTVSIGAWVGDRIAAGLHFRALARAAGDRGLHQDVERWAAMSRQMMAKRELIAGDLRRQPFRHEREPWALAEVSQPLLAGGALAGSLSA